MLVLNEQTLKTMQLTILETVIDNIQKPANVAKYDEIQCRPSLKSTPPIFSWFILGG